MTQGRLPTPNVIRLLRGNPGHRPINDAAPVVPPKMPAPPRHMSKEAKREWRWITPKLATYKMITEIDRTVLELYCEAYARWRQAEQKLTEANLVLVSREGQPFHNPWLSISKQAVAQIHRCLAQLGMTPSARATLITRGREPEIPPAGGGRADPLGILG